MINSFSLYIFLYAKKYYYNKKMKTVHHKAYKGIINTVNAMDKDANIENYVRCRRSDRLRKKERGQQRAGSEPRCGGSKGRKYYGNTGKVKPESSPKCCSFCKPFLVNSRLRLLDAKLRAGGYYE
jgi:hypothetical protein